MKNILRRHRDHNGGISPSPHGAAHDVLVTLAAVRGDDALQISLVVTAVRVRYAAPC